MNGVDDKVRPSVLAVTGATNKDKTETPYTIQNSHARTQIHEKRKKNNTRIHVTQRGGKTTNDYHQSL